jgi:hypothetical protein
VSGGSLARTLQGQKYTWQLSDRPIGSGDAGEVYTVTCLDQPELQAVMKKPAHIATGGTIQRQAGEIAQEYLALARLDGLPRGKAHPPRLLDQAHQFTHGTANYFFVSEFAPGENIAALLQNTRQKGKPFPRRVIITVLDALFDLFARAHKAGVLWNDVKLDHIYWHNPTGQITVIDWGNALFLEGGRTNGQLSLPRWEDYRQMVEILGSFLKQTAPELFSDLGWDEFQDRELEATQVSVLARRIAYQQQVVALNVMEYQSLLRVLLNAEPTLDGLERMQELQQQLERIGAPWEQEGVLNYAQELIVQSFREKNHQTGVRATMIIWALFDTSLDLPWHLVREYLRDPNLINHPLLESLVRHTFNSNWQEALWTLMRIAQDHQGPPWWEHLMPVIRQQASGSVTPPPYQICRSLLAWQKAQGIENKDVVQNLSRIVDDWRTVGENSQKSPFEYAILDMLDDKISLSDQIRSDLKKSFAAGEAAIREISRVWQQPDWDGLHAALRQSAAWDPDRWGILQLADKVNVFQGWLKDLHSGPAPSVSIKAFLQNHLENRPPLERALGSPPWLLTLLQTLNLILRGAPIVFLRAQVERWCPWLLNYADINHGSGHAAPLDQHTVNALLPHFVSHLKNWSDVEAALDAIRSDAYEHYSVCRQIFEGFTRFSSLSANLNEYQSMQCAENHPALLEACRVLQALLTWREHITDERLATAYEDIMGQPFEGWRVLDHVRQQTQRWFKHIMPLLESMLTYASQTERVPADYGENMLVEVLNHFSDLHLAWNRVYQEGLPSINLTLLEESIEQARNGFFAWRRAYKETGDQVSLLLYHSHRDTIRQISQLFYKLSEHIRLAKHGFSSLQDANEVSPRMQLQTGENILEHLGAIEEMLVTTPEDRYYPEWQVAFREIFAGPFPLTSQERILSLPENHPLYAWLVQSTFGQSV